ncbi:UbiA family prenyltransferase [Streptomyces sp. NPDC059491]|uniref:UbiA family prenyltransferase n=1 Tax=Streptomyces sp. NPDC059491 TaxID=3346850 RepID=UPI0036795CEB
MSTGEDEQKPREPAGRTAAFPPVGDGATGRRTAHPPWPRLTGHAETLRPYDLVVVSLVGAAGAASGAPDADPVAVAAAAVAAAAACASALYAADYLTRSQDMATKPHRPIPSGRLSPRAAKTATATAATLMLVTASLYNVRSLLFVALGAAAYYAYGRRLKDRGLWGDLASGFSGWSCTLLAGACLTAPWPPAALVAPAVALGLQGAYGNLLLALDDHPHDVRAHCRTFPVRHGTARTATALTLLSGATYAIAVCLPLLTGHRPTAAFLLLLAAALSLAVATLAAVRVRPTRPRQAVTRHLFERLLLPGALLALADRPSTAASATAVAALVVALTPRPMLRTDPPRGEVPGGASAE